MADTLPPDANPREPSSDSLTEIDPALADSPRLNVLLPSLQMRDMSGGPNTALHMLSNGRLFNYLTLCREIAAIDHPDLMIGIPLYSDIPHRHDFVVQADGAKVRDALAAIRFNGLTGPLTFDKDSPKKDKEEVVVLLMPQLAPGTKADFVTADRELASKLAKAQEKLTPPTKVERTRKCPQLGSPRIVRIAERSQGRWALRRDERGEGPAHE